MKSLDAFCRQYGRQSLLDEWNGPQNQPLTPETVTYGSHRRVWWECSVGHVWKALVYSRTTFQRCGCPICAGTLRERPHQPAKIAL